MNSREKIYNYAFPRFAFAKIVQKILLLSSSFFKALSTIRIEKWMRCFDCSFYPLFDLIRYSFIVKNEVSKRCKEIKPIKILKKSIPLIDWLFSYNWKNNIIGDIVAGITVAVMHIPQGAM